MANSGVITKSFFNNNYTLNFEWALESQSVPDKTSTISWWLKLSTTADSKINYSSNTSVKVTVDGQVYSLSTSLQTGYSTTLSLTSGTQIINHDESGAKTFSVSFSVNPQDFAEFVYDGASHTKVATMTGSGSGELPTITWAAQITNAPNFTDEDSPTITYVNPLGSLVTSLQACISLTGSDDEIAYRNIPITGSSYTFSFTTADKNWMWSKLDEGLTSVTMYYRIKTIYNGETIFSNPYVTKLSIINYKPKVEPLLWDENTTTAALTGNDEKFIKGYSDVYFNLRTSGQKGAEIDSRSIWNGNQYKYTEIGTLTDVATNEFKWSVTDSRGYTTNGYKIYPIEDGSFVEYIPLTCSITNNPLTAEGYLTITLSGKFWNGYFGAKNNNLKMQYHYAEGGGQFTSSQLTQITPTVDDNYNYSYSFTISGLNYQKQYRLYVTVKDELEQIDSTTIVVAAGEPLFDWSKNDFNFNIPVNFSKGFTQPNSALKQLWNGNFQMTGGQSVDLIENISSQANGIVLVFTPFDTSTNLANDEKLMSFFVSKKAVQVMPRKMHTFHLISGADFATIGAKSVYIADEKISGYATNDDTGTKNGITFANNKFVLRYVLGV